MNNALAEAFGKVHPDLLIKQFYETQVRPDGRGFRDFRKVHVETNTVTNAMGSAFVIIGGTSVLCKATAEFSEPDLRTPDHGYLVPTINCRNSLLKDTIGTSLATREKHITKKLLNVLYGSNFIHLKDLCIFKSKLVWTVYLEVTVISSDGPLFDAILLATTAALANLALPSVKLDPETEQAAPQFHLPRKRFNLARTFVPITAGVYKSNASKNNLELIIDPTNKELDLLDTIITLVIDDATRQIVHFEKHGCLAVEPALVEKLYQLGVQHAPSVKAMLVDAQKRD